jgi:hypothetical protein
MVMALTLLSPAVIHAADIGKTFPTPQAAVSALATAASAKDRDALRSLFGLATDELVAADKVQASNELAQFVTALNQTNRLVAKSDTRCILEVGSQLWPFPIPIVKRDNRRFLDTEDGREELINRHIGRNELTTLQAIGTALFVSP